MSDHKTYDELHQLLKEAHKKAPLGSVWYHRKTPDAYYTVVDLIIDEPTDSVAVVYQPVLGARDIRFVRSLESFLESPAGSDTLQTRFVRVRF